MVKKRTVKLEKEKKLILLEAILFNQIHEKDNAVVWAS